MGHPRFVMGKEEQSVEKGGPPARSQSSQRRGQNCSYGGERQRPRRNSRFVGKV